MLVNPCDANENFIPALRHCILELRSLAHAMSGGDACKSSIGEFLYKLKCLERELYLVSFRLKEAFKRNEQLTKALEVEKEKSRRKTAKMHALEAQLASAEFKLRVRATPAQRSAVCQLQPRTTKPKRTRDAHVQSDYQAENAAEVLRTVRSLGRKAQSTLHTIRNIVSEQGGAPRPHSEPMPAQAPSSTSICSSGSGGDVGASRHSEAYKILKAMQNGVRRLKMQNCCVGGDVRCEVKRQAALLQQQLASYR